MAPPGLDNGIVCTQYPSTSGRMPLGGVLGVSGSHGGARAPFKLLADNGGAMQPGMAQAGAGGVPHSTKQGACREWWRSLRMCRHAGEHAPGQGASRGIRRSGNTRPPRHPPLKQAQKSPGRSARMGNRRAVPCARRRRGSLTQCSSMASMGLRPHRLRHSSCSGSKARRSRHCPALRPQACNSSSSTSSSSSLQEVPAGPQQPLVAPACRHRPSLRNCARGHSRG